MSPPVSVIIPTHDRPALLRDAIVSLERQTVRPDEVVVVDDGSPTPVAVDSTLDVRVVRTANAGAAAARNLGVSAASGELLFFLDDDDVFGVDRIRHAIDAHAHHDIVVCAKGSFDDGAPAEHARPGPAPPSLQPTTTRSLLHRTTPHLDATSVRRHVWIPLDDTYLGAEDVEWWIRMAANHPTVGRISSTDTFVRVHGGVRHLNGVEARLAGSRRLLSEHAEFFRNEQKAAAFRYARMSLMSTELGERGSAIRFALSSLRHHPSRAGAYALGTAVRSRTAPDAAG